MLIFRGVTILSEGSNFKSLRKKDQLMHHILVLQLHMSWSTFNQQEPKQIIGVYYNPPRHPTRPHRLEVTLLGAVRSKRIRSFDLVPGNSGPRGLKIPRISSFCHLKWISFFLGKLLTLIIPTGWAQKPVRKLGCSTVTHWFSATYGSYNSGK